MIGMPEDSLPPHDSDSEKALISCAIQSPEKAFPRVARLVKTDYFYEFVNRIVWSIIVHKKESGETINTVTMMIALKDQDVFEKAGGIEWLNSLVDFSPSPENILEHASRVIEFHRRRKILASAIKLSNMVVDGCDFNEIQSSVDLISSEEIKSNPVTNGVASSEVMVDDLERRFKLNGALSGVDTGFYGINSMTDGIQYGEQTLIGARPSMGKTAIGLNIFSHAVFNVGIPSLFISLEMSTASLMKRMLSSIMDFPMGSIRKGSYSESDFGRFSLFQIKCSKSPIFIADLVSGANFSDIATIVRDHVRRFGIKLVVIDYLQKIRPTGKHEKRTYEIGDVSGRLKSLAVDTGAAFLTLAQLNRESEKDKGRMPRLSDLADSGQIERDADTVMLIHRDRSGASSESKIIVAKQRDGEVGVVNLNFNGVFCRFENPSKISDADVP